MTSAPSHTATPVSEREDAELAAMVAAGSTEALEALYQRYSRVVMSFSTRMMGDRLSGEELVQEVFLKMQTRGATEAIQNIEGYLFRTAATVLVDRHRARGAERLPHDTIPDAGQPYEDLSPERVLMGKESMELVIAALEGLPPRTREAFVLHRFEEMTYGAIARRMGISIKTVEKQVSCAIRRVMECVRARQ